MFNYLNLYIFAYINLLIKLASFPASLSLFTPAASGLTLRGIPSYNVSGIQYSNIAMC